MYLCRAILTTTTMRIWFLSSVFLLVTIALYVRACVCVSVLVSVAADAFESSSRF